MSFLTDRDDLVDKKTGLAVKDFEELIDNYTSIEEMMSILRLDEDELNGFCNRIYNGMSFRDVHKDLTARAMFHNKKAINSLAKAGNGKALEILVKCMMKLDSDDRNKALKIIVSGDIPKKD